MPSAHWAIFVAFCSFGFSAYLHHLWAAWFCCFHWHKPPCLLWRIMTFDNCWKGLEEVSPFPARRSVGGSLSVLKYWLNGFQLLNPSVTSPRHHTSSPLFALSTLLLVSLLGKNAVIPTSWRSCSFEKALLKLSCSIWKCLELLFEILGHPVNVGALLVASSAERIPNGWGHCGKINLVLGFVLLSCFVTFCHFALSLF